MTTCEMPNIDSKERGLGIFRNKWYCRNTVILQRQNPRVAIWPPRKSYSYGKGTLRPVPVLMKDCVEYQNRLTISLDNVENVTLKLRKHSIFRHLAKSECFRHSPTHILDLYLDPHDFLHATGYGSTILCNFRSIRC